MLRRSWIDENKRFNRGGIDLSSSLLRRSWMMKKNIGLIEAGVI